jgi:hypothetical protein
MNEAERLKEKKETDDRIKTRKKELIARPEPNEKVYEITLKLTDEPGLPPPVTKTNHVSSSKTNLPVWQAEGGKPNPTYRIAKTGDKPSPAASEKKADADSEESLDDKLPNLDIPLEEVKRILIDLVKLSSKRDGLAISTEKK